MADGTQSAMQRQWLRAELQIISMPVAPASYGTGAQTYTAANLLNQIIVHDGTGNATSTLSTAALLAAAMRANANPLAVGDTISTEIINGGTGTITIAAGTGGGFDTNQLAASRTVPANSSKTLFVRMTNVTPGSEAYTAYF